MTTATATRSSGSGVYAHSAGQVTVDSEITVPAGAAYIRTGSENKLPDDHIPASSKPGYLEYTDGNSAVWVVAHACENTDTGIRYESVTEAIAAVPDGEAAMIRLLRSFSHDGQVTVDNKIITFSLNGKTLNVTNPSTANSSCGLLVQNNGEVSLSGAGALNVSGYDGVRAESGAKATVTNAAATGQFGSGAYAASSSQVSVNRIITSTYVGAYANGGQITVNGEISVPAEATYIIVGSVSKAPDDHVTSSTKPGYLQYTSGASTVWVTMYVCIDTLTGIKYESVTNAIAAVPDGGEATFRLLRNTSHANQINIDNKMITFELDGKTLTINNMYSVGRNGFRVLNGGELSIIGEGALNITSEIGVTAIDGGKITITNVSMRTRSSLCSVWAQNASQITINGDVAAENGDGVFAVDSGTQVTINGNLTVTAVTNSTNYGVEVVRGAVATVNGNITTTSAYSYGVYVDSGNAIVTVNGNITTTGSNSRGVTAYNSSQATVNGDISATGANSRGVFAYSASQVTVNGDINVPAGAIYVRVGNAEKTPNDHIPVSSKPGYLEYTDGTSFVWVRDPSSLSGTLSIDLNTTNGVLTANTDAVTGADGGFIYNWSGVGVRNFGFDKLEYYSNDYQRGEQVTLTLTSSEASGSLTAVITVYTVSNGIAITNGTTGTFTVPWFFGRVGDTVPCLYDAGNSAGVTFASWNGPVTLINNNSAYIINTGDAGGGHVTITATFEASAIRYGDVNGDGVINLLDVTRLLQFIRGIDISDDGYIAVNADANGDGVVNMLDVTAILRFVRGIDPGPLGPNTAPIAPAMFGFSFAPFMMGTDTVVSVSDTSGKAGDEVTMNVSLENNPGIASFSLTMLYPDELEFISSQPGDIISDNYYCYSPANGQINVSATSFDGADVAFGTVLFTLTFRIKDGAEAGVIDGIDLGLHLEGDLIENDAKYLPVEFSQGSVTVEAAVEAPALVSAATRPADFVSIVETSKNSKVWALTFKVTETWSDGETKVVTHTIELSGANANLDGRYVFEQSHALAGHTLVFDIKGNGSNIKDLRLVIN